MKDISKDFVSGTYDEVKRRVISGGKYAVMSVNRDDMGDIGNNISAAWKRFNLWRQDSKYLWGGKKYLEEHIGFSKTEGNVGGVDLYNSIADSPQIDSP